MSEAYANIFVHGYCGWGDKDRLTGLMPYFGGFHRPGIAQFLTENGYESYAPSAGPWNSAWDRACELYAQIVGGTVDYGKVHSEKNGHARYGRTYEGYFKDWGEPGSHEKINLIGHSFGGPTISMFADLLDRGSEEERAATPADELSPLFAGGNAHLVHSVTTISGTNNGTTLADAARDLHVDKFVNWLMLSAANTLLKKTGLTKFYDPRLDLWGDDVLEKCHACRLDNSLIAQSTALTAEFNETVSISDEIYYFAHPACKSHKILITPFHAMELKSFPLAHLGQLIIGWYGTPTLKRTLGVDKKWYQSDGIVNTLSTMAPRNKPQETWTENTEVVPGKWYNMPIEHKDHFSWMGFFEKRSDYEKYFLDLCDFLAKL